MVSSVQEILDTEFTEENKVTIPPPVQLTLQIIADCRLVIQQEVKRMKTKALQDLPLSNSEGLHLHGLIKTLSLAEDLERKQHVEQLTDGQLSELLSEVMKYEAKPIPSSMLPIASTGIVSNRSAVAKKKKRSQRGRG